MRAETLLPEPEAWKLCQRLWAYVHKRTLHDKDLAATLDILKSQMNNGYLTASHGKAALFILGRHETGADMFPPLAKPTIQIP